MLLFNLLVLLNDFIGHQQKIKTIIITDKFSYKFIDKKVTYVSVFISDNAKKY